MALIDNLIAYYPLDEASGDAIDAHSNGYDLTQSSGTIAATTGLVGGARDLEAGDTEWFEIPDNADFSTGDVDWTVAGWVMFETDVTMTIASKWITTGDQREWMLRRNGTSNLVEILITTAGTSATLVTTSASDFGATTTATWYFVCARHDAAGNTIAVFVNGTKTSASHSGGVFSGTAEFALGGQGASFYDGLLDEFGFWKRALSDSEITELYNAGAGRDYAYIAGGAPAASILPKMMNYGLYAGRAA